MVADKKAAKVNMLHRTRTGDQEYGWGMVTNWMVVG